MQQLSQSEWSQQAAASEDAVIIDVRTPNEVAQGIIPGAVHIDIMNAAGFMEAVKEMNKSVPYYVYCRAGGRSAQACMIMDSLGFEQTFNLVGGIDQWKGEVTTNS